MSGVGTRPVTLVLACGLLVAGCTRPAESPAPVASITGPSPAGGPGVRITGLETYPAFVAVGLEAALTATRVDVNGDPVEDCTKSATWSSNDPLVAQFNVMGPNGQSGKNVVVALADGTTTLSATCGGLVGRASIVVDHFILRGRVRSSGQLAADARVTLRNRPAYGHPATEYEVVPVGADGSFSARASGAAADLYVGAPASEGRTTSIAWNRQPSMTLEFDLEPVPTPFLVRTGTLDASRRDAVFSMTVPRDGDLTVHALFGIEKPGEGSAGLAAQCNGQTIRVTDTFSHPGYSTSMRLPVTTACRYSIIFFSAGQTTLPYEISMALR